MKHCRPSSVRSERWTDGLEIKNKLEQKTRQNKLKYNRET